MILDVTRALVIALDGAGTDVEIIVDYKDWNPQGQETPPSTYFSLSNGTSDVPILPAPIENPKREPLRLSIFNGGSGTHVVTIKVVGAVTRTIIKPSLAGGKSVIWESGSVWEIGI